MEQGRLEANHVAGDGGLALGRLDAADLGIVRMLHFVGPLGDGDGEEGVDDGQQEDQGGNWQKGLFGGTELELLHDGGEATLGLHRREFRGFRDEGWLRGVTVRRQRKGREHQEKRGDEQWQGFCHAGREIISSRAEGKGNRLPERTHSTG